MVVYLFRSNCALESNGLLESGRLTGKRLIKFTSLGRTVVQTWPDIDCRRLNFGADQAARRKHLDGTYRGLI